MARPDSGGSSRSRGSRPSAPGGRGGAGRSSSGGGEGRGGGRSGSGGRSSGPGSSSSGGRGRTGSGAGRSSGAAPSGGRGGAGGRSGARSAGGSGARSAGGSGGSARGASAARSGARSSGARSGPGAPRGRDGDRDRPARAGRGAGDDRRAGARPARGRDDDRPRRSSSPSGSSTTARGGADERASRRSAPRGGNAGRSQGTGRAWDDEPALETPKSWGGVARRGAGAATGRRVAGASRAWREAVEAASPRRPPTAARRAAADPDAERTAESDAERRARNDARKAEDWLLVEEVRDEAAGAVSRGARTRRRPVGEAAPLDLAEEVREQLSKAVGTARSERVERRLGEAAEAFEADRYGDAARILKKLSDEAPTVPAVRELYGLTLYRKENWTQAARELEAFRQLSGSTEQHPVLADCYRALRQWPQVDELWDELRAASPDAELVTEGRIVMAGALADRDRVVEAIALLQSGWRFPKRPRAHHLRRAYVLADLYERAGELPRARDLFGRIRAVDPEFADVGVRIRNLR